MLLETKNFFIYPVLAFLMAAAFLTLYGGLLMSVNAMYLVITSAAFTFTAIIVGIRI